MPILASSASSLPSSVTISGLISTLSKEDLGTAGNYIKSASNFAVDTGAVSYNGIIFSFENEENLLKAYDILNIAPIQENGSLFRVGNFLIEMENETIRPILDQLGTLSVTFNQ